MLISEQYRKEQEALHAKGNYGTASLGYGKIISALLDKTESDTDEYGVNDNAKLLHWTCGIPGFRHYKNAPHADKWFRANAMANHATT